MIHIQNVTKKFPNGLGIFDLSLQIPRGEAFGYLGPNGAGKSTTIRTVMGFLRADTGVVQIDGRDCWREAAKLQEIIGYLPGEISFIEGMTGLEFLHLIASMRKMRDNTRRDEMIERLNLDVKTDIRKMSKGMKQKVGIVAALMHRPQVLILDEPTSGLDPLMQKIFLELVLEEKQQGTTIFMSSHAFPEVERICDRVGILKDGHLVAVENIAVLRAEQRKVFSVELANLSDISHLTDAGCVIVRTDRKEVEIEVQGTYDDFIQALAKCRVLRLNAHELNLEQLFMHYYSRKERFHS